MGRHFTLALRLPRYRETHKEKNIAKTHATKLGIYLMFGCLTLVVAYLVQVNSFSTKGYEIKRLQKHVETLKDENKKLSISSEAMQSMQQVQSDSSTIGMVPVMSINYIHAAALTQR